MNKTVFAIPSLVAGLLCAFSGAALSRSEDEAPMPLLYEAASRESPAFVHKGTCPVRVVATEDRRLNRQTIGANMSGPLLTGEASPWVTDGLLHLKDFGYAVQRVEPDAAAGEGLLVKTSLTRAYTWQVGLKIFSMIALKAQISDKDGQVQEKYYRAHGDKTNMWGARGEYVTTLNYGLNNLLRVMAEDLSALCQGKKVDAYTYAGPDPKPAAAK